LTVILLNIDIAKVPHVLSNGGIHGALEKASDMGIMGLLMGMFDLTASGITAAIVFTFIFSLLFNPKN